MDIRETNCEYLVCDNHASFFSSESKWIRKIHALQSTHPDEVTIVHDSPESIIAHIPKSWMKISPPRKLNLTEEQRQERVNRLQQGTKKGDS